MAIEISEGLQQRLQSEQVLWLTTVRPDGTPQPAPVWFLWEGGTFLIFSQPGSKRIRNLRQNAKVALNLNTDEYGGKVAVFWGEASIEEGASKVDQVAAYVEKYRQGLVDINSTPESMAKEYSLAIRVTPVRVRED